MTAITQVAWVISVAYALGDFLTTLRFTSRMHADLNVGAHFVTEHFGTEAQLQKLHMSLSNTVFACNLGTISNAPSRSHLPADSINRDCTVSDVPAPSYL